ncbi:hypothetical protein [Frankia gtarii]|uniref:hypothetical protein n=1 Tax=Frankia gtarii TaxID=2950102 RepID=UPI0021C2311C|nr:hypothetical protein [Frankia gtarii]
MTGLGAAEAALLALGIGRPPAYAAGVDDALDALGVALAGGDADAWRDFLQSLDGRSADYRSGVEDAAHAVAAVISAVRAGRGRRPASRHANERLSS